MYVSVNKKNEIKKVGISTDTNLTSLYIDENDKDYPFEGWSEAKICCYKIRVTNGHIVELSPYVDSRFIEHFDQLGLATEVNEESLTDTQMAICDNYEDFIEYSAATDEAIETGNTQITDLEMAICDIYEMIAESL